MAIKLRKTYTQKPSEVERKWYLIDASKAPVGRIAVEIAKMLSGRGKVTYTPHVDGGDYVVVINVKDFVVTGDKELAKRYYSYSGFPGGIKHMTVEEVRAKKPELAIISAVKGMLPKNKLQADMLKRLKVYAGSEHGHTAQKPKKVEIK